MNLIDATNSIKFFELGGAIIGFLYYRKLKDTFWKYLPVFLLVLFCLELYGQFLGEHKKYDANINLFKLVVVPSIFSFYSFIFYKILSKKRLVLICIGLVLFILSLVLEYTILKSFHPFYASLSIGIVNIFFLVYCILFYIELINSEELMKFYTLLSFWFCSGILIFYLGCLPYFGLYNLLATKFFKSIFLPYTWIFVGLNYIMYSFFIVGIIWSKKK